MVNQNSNTEINAELAQLRKQVADLQVQLADTQGQHLEQQAENSRLTGRMDNLLNLLPAGVLVVDHHGLVSEANLAAAELLGEPLLGESWLGIIQRSFAPRSDDGHEVSLKSGRRVSLSTRSLESETGQLIMLTDQTETRLLQGQVAHYQRLSEMGRMMASLAHQIRTPLSAALLYASHLIKPGLQADKQIKFAGKIKSRLENLEHQVRDMLVFARGETRLDDRLTLAQLFRDIEDALDVPLAAWDADCECINGVPALQLQCNKEALLGALMNLVENSLQATGKGAELSIEASVLDERLCLMVSDNGPGMDQEQCRKVLEPFYSTKSHGTGLGLAVAQVVAKAHHGEFILVSEPGKGTRTAFLLPYEKDANVSS